LDSAIEVEVWLLSGDSTDLSSSSDAIGGCTAAEAVGGAPAKFFRIDVLRPGIRPFFGCSQTGLFLGTRYGDFEDFRESSALHSESKLLVFVFLPRRLRRNAFCSSILLVSAGLRRRSDGFTIDAEVSLASDCLHGIFAGGGIDIPSRAMIAGEERGIRSPGFEYWLRLSLVKSILGVIAGETRGVRENYELVRNYYAKQNLTESSSKGSSHRRAVVSVKNGDIVLKSILWESLWPEAK
jgi:hypothetical protein